jgi:hypothetical protein
MNLEISRSSLLVLQTNLNAVDIPTVLPRHDRKQRHGQSLLYPMLHSASKFAAIEIGDLQKPNATLTSNCFPCA